MIALNVKELGEWVRAERMDTYRVFFRNPFGIVGRQDFLARDERAAVAMAEVVVTAGVEAAADADSEEAALVASVPFAEARSAQARRAPAVGHGSAILPAVPGLPAAGSITGSGIGTASSSGASITTITPMIMTIPITITPQLSRRRAAVSCRPSTVRARSVIAPRVTIITTTGATLTAGIITPNLEVRDG